MDDDHPAALVLDSQGLSEAARGAPILRALIRRARGAGVPVVVSAVTLAEVLRGHRRDAAVHLFLKGCRIESVGSAIGRAAGDLLGRTGRKDTVDAVVVATAMALPAPVLVLTSDPADIAALAEDLAGVTVAAV
jgi:predicted nucleic acid-binding protein